MDQERTKLNQSTNVDFADIGISVSKDYGTIPRTEEPKSRGMVLRKSAKQKRTMTTLRATAVSILIGLIASATYFAYHHPGALEVAMEKQYDWSPADIGVLFTTYSIPPFWMTYVTGVGITKYGLKTVGFGMLAFIVAGQLVGALAPMITSSATGYLWIWAIARFIVGAGGESMVTWQQSACAIWFSGSYIGVTMATALATQQVIGSALSFFILPYIADVMSLTAAHWATVIFCAVCLALLFLYGIMENLHKWWFDQISEDVSEEEEQKQPALMRDYPSIFWLQNVVVFLAVSVLYSSANFFPDFFEEQYGFTLQETGRCASMFYWMMIAAPFAGMLTDKYGNRLNLQIICCFLISLLYLQFYIAPNLMSPWATMILMGLCFACTESNAYVVLEGTWKDVEGDAVGVGYAIMGVALNAGLMVLPFGVGWLATITGTTIYQNLLFSAIMFASCLCSFVIRSLGGKRLNLKLD